ncbi:ABC transporter ATP-binding protein [Leptospira wolffii]|uniref:ABC transporter ATP-binding protein n=1 Tax=Leptospira wolffii TaxID=409998 RepID=A0A2M9ZDX3_9LEPT|nr:ABC transporter ATP-binding protein [Leptospira wolffii]PJZ66562.1 ABC transporter ATP-binding protein [Leptospira wolffii]TGK61542.1 ABC transporter ATP-binding protein [Leptospira wolffii]TGK70086.1 ABC transporter ATP-binding protein [Leptospira wolffii]TGK77009.1 ABC transporter ATP-binding protein [Leptospira wolffii]TGL31139.1 ABC transporter ATP-binding protein [Leptospira wolffii]
MPEFAIEIENLRKNYPRVQALKGVSLQVPKGGVFGLLGQNGAGKTTLVRILLGFSKQTDGDCEVLGLRPSPRTRAKIGYLPERMAVPAYLSGKEFLEASLKLALLPSSLAKSRSKELLEKLGLASAADRKVSTYSKGMLQRLGLANALGGEPELLLLDEPGTGLDPAGYKEFRDLILEENAKRGVTILINSHRLLEVEQICTEVGILHKGKIMAHGKLDELRQGKDRLRIKLEGDLDSYLKEISAEYKQSGKEWELLPKPGTDLRRLPAELVERGADILLYEKRTESLEEVFFRLTQGTDADRNTEEAGEKN